MKDDYRARATKAEQENAVLRKQLAKPKYAGLQKTVTEMLRLPIDAPINEIARCIKYLRDNHDLYKAGSEMRKLNNEEKKQLIEEGKKQGIAEAIANLRKYL